MFRSTIHTGRALLALLLLALSLTACGSVPPSDEAAAPEAAAPSAGTLSADEANPDSSAGADGIDLAALDICATFPQAAVEPITGPLVAAPTPTIAVGNEVGCEYEVDGGRAYTITAYDLDRWELLPDIFDVRPIPGLGDGAYAATDASERANLFVLLRNRAVVNVAVNGVETPKLRTLLDAAIAGLR